MSTNLIYKHPALYEVVNRLLYGRHHDARYRAVADLIPAGATVLDLCCGPATLFHRHLWSKSVSYTGLDLSPSFIESLARRGGHGLIWDVRSDASLPKADYVVMQGALYFFLPDPSPLLQRMFKAAKRQVIIAEAIRNLSNSRLPLLSNLAVRLAGGVKGHHPLRFTEETLDSFMRAQPWKLERSFKISGERDKVYVFQNPDDLVAAP